MGRVKWPFEVLWKVKRIVNLETQNFQKSYVAGFTVRLYSYYRFGIDNKYAVIAGTVEKASLEVLERRGKRFGLCSEEAEVFFPFPFTVRTS